MSNSIKRFRISNDDDDDDCVFTGSADESQADLSSNGERRQRLSTHTFLDKIDVLSNSFSSSPSEPIYDLSNLSNFSHHVDVIESDQKTSPDCLMTSNEKSNGVTLVHASKKKRSKKLFALRDVGRWKPSDDLLLIISVLQVNDLDIVSTAAKFSCKFTFGEVQARWNALLFDELVSRTARSAIHKMHPEQQASVHSRAPFSLAEEDLLCDILSTDSPSLEDFQFLLDRNSGAFYHSRTAKSLQKHWRLLRKYELLCDQRPNGKCCAAGELPSSLSDTETEINIESLKDSSFPGHVDQEIKLMDQQMKRKTRLLEDELGHWMQLLGISSKSMDLGPKFDSKTFAILRGQCIRYAMRTRFISFGRLTNNGEGVDVDLSVEGAVHKVSRYQGGIELRDNGTFATCNFGKRPFYVDGVPVFPEKMIVIRNNSIFEICGITLIFLINKELVEDVCFNEFDTD